MKELLITAISLVLSLSSHGEIQESPMDAIHSGVAWYDDRRKIVSAHGAGIIKDGDRYFLFGEFKRDHGNEFSGVSCYSSADLIHWKFERIALPVQKDGRLGPNSVGERPKVLKCPKTGKFVMYLHTDDIDYKDPSIGYATCDTVNGEYQFQGVLKQGDSRIKKWDISAFQDDDGRGYIVTHSGNLYQLSDDYQSITAKIVEDMTHGCEAPALFKRDDTYYWLGSDLSGWERNDNYYFTAKSLKGPWEKRGNFAPEGTLTWNSQTTFVLPVQGTRQTTYLFMGDRWAHPRQNSAATYVWQPLRFDEKGNLSLPEFQHSWRIDIKSGIPSSVSLTGRTIDISEIKGIQRSGEWSTGPGISDLRSKEKGASLTFPFTGTQIGFDGVARPDGGFGEVRIKNQQGETILTTIVESYCHYQETSLKFLSPILKQGNYTLTLTVLGEHFFWEGKKATYGSKGDFVSIKNIHITGTGDKGQIQN